MRFEAQNSPTNRQAQIETIQRAAAEAVREALRRHMLLGESVVVASPDGKPRTLAPAEIRKRLDAA